MVPNMFLSRRSAVQALGILGGSALTFRQAQASTAIALSLAELVKQSDRVVVGTPVAFDSDWAYIGGARRIITWTRVIQEGDLLGDESERDEVMIMTLGGKVGSLRQKVSGEAALRIGQRCVTFVGSENDLARRVIGMAQGHYPLTTAEDAPSLQSSRELPHLLGRRPASGPAPKRAAVDVLPGRHLKNLRKLLLEAR